MVNRAERVAQLLKQEIADLLMKEVKDPRLGLVTVNRVELSKDLRHAKVYVGSLELGATRSNLLQGLESASGFIRRELRKRLDLRRVPELLFRIDENVEYGVRIASLLREIEESNAGHG